MILFGDERIVTPGHDRAGLGFAVQNGQLCRHTLRGGKLIFAAERHQNRVCADGGVKALGKPALGADIQVVCQRFEFLRVGFADNGLFDCRESGNLNAGVLFSAVGV